MKNNKGFAVTTMLYGLSIMGFLIVVLLMSIMSNNRVNTNDLVKQIEDDLNKFSGSEVTFNSDNQFTVPIGAAGYYKIELWGKSSWTAFIIKLEVNTTLYYYKDSDESYIAAKPKGSGSIIATTKDKAKGGLVPESQFSVFEQETDEYDNAGNPKKVYIRRSNIKPNNLQEIDSPAIWPKGSIRILTTNDTFDYQAFATDNYSTAIYVLLQGRTAGDNKTNKALTLNTTTGIVSFEQFTGNKNQQWQFNKINNAVSGCNVDQGTTKPCQYTIVNAANGTALEAATDSINNATTNGDVVANQQPNVNHNHMRWELEFNYSGGYSSLSLRPRIFAEYYASPREGFLRGYNDPASTTGNVATFTEDKALSTHEAKFSLQNVN